jgi:hypothetical protein
MEVPIAGSARAAMPDRCSRFDELGARRVRRWDDGGHEPLGRAFSREVGEGDDMEIELMVERFRMLSRHPDKTIARREIRKLLHESPLRSLMLFSKLVECELWEAASDYLDRLPEIPPEDIHLTATELTPRLAEAMSLMNVQTVGQAAQYDDEALHKRGWHRGEIAELKLVVGKYLRPVLQQRRLRPAVDVDDPNITEGQRQDLLISREIASGGTDHGIARKLRLPVERVRMVRNPGYRPD